MAESRRTGASRILPRIISDINTLARMEPVDSTIMDSHTNDYSDKHTNEYSDHHNNRVSDEAPPVTPGEDVVVPPIEGDSYIDDHIDEYTDIADEYTDIADETPPITPGENVVVPPIEGENIITTPPTEEG